MLRQKQLHRRVAALTGDDLSTITRLGFSIVCDTQDPDASDTASHDFDPFTDPAVAELAAWALEDRSPVARPRVVDWDSLECSRRVALFA